MWDDWRITKLKWSVFYHFLTLQSLACEENLVWCLSSESSSGSGWSGSSPMALGGTTGDKLVSLQTEIWVHMTWASSCPPQSSPAAPHTAKWECPLCKKLCSCASHDLNKAVPRVSLLLLNYHTHTYRKTVSSHHGQNTVYYLYWHIGLKNLLMNIKCWFAACQVITEFAVGAF